jgi:hypothetical protein
MERPVNLNPRSLTLSDVNPLRRTICIGFLFLLLSAVILAGNARGQQEAIIKGRKGNVNDQDADILQASFQLLENGSLVILYVVEGKFVDRYIYGINLYAYGENQSFGSIVLGYFQNTKGAYYVDSGKGRVKDLQYTIQGSTLKITGLTFVDIGGNDAFYAAAQTVARAEQNKQLVLIDSEPAEGLVKVMLTNPSPEPTETPSPPTTAPTTTSQPTTTTQPTTQATTQPTTTIPQTSPATTFLIIVAIVAILLALMIWRSSSKAKTQEEKPKR